MTRKEPRWLPLQAVLAMQNELIVEHGGLGGLAKRECLESALARPRQLATYAESPPTLAELAASYGYGLIRNHCFVDGNKRIGLTAIDVFLRLNGAELTATEPDTVHAILNTASGAWQEADLAAWIANNSSESTA